MGKSSLIVGVLALQGGFAKHCEMLRELGVEAIEVRKPEDLKCCDGLIIPGGESTTIMKQMKYIKLDVAFKEFFQKKPVFGTCAGLILMSQEILSDKMEPFHLLNIKVERNAFGRQADSFHVNLSILLNKNKPCIIPAVFIRAPRIRVIDDTVQVLATYEGEPVLVQQGFHLGASFHPELTNDLSVHEYFIKLISQVKSSYD